MDNKAFLIERYENLRSFALGHQQEHVHWQNDHIGFIRKGMNSWIIEEEIKAPIKSKIATAFINADKKNNFQFDCEPKIMQTIADILLKKIKENKCYC